MVGQGVLRETLRADDVTLVQTVGRSSADVTHAKLREVLLLTWSTTPQSRDNWLA